MHMKRLTPGRILTLLLPVLALTSGGGLLPIPQAGAIQTVKPTPAPDEDGSITLQSGEQLKRSNVATTGATFTSGGAVYASGGTLTLVGVTIPFTPGGTLTLNGGNFYTGATTVSAIPSLPLTAKAPALSGTAGELKVGNSADGSKLRVKTSVAVTNSGTKAAKGVTATVYLSDDAVLDTTEDTKIATLSLADFFPETGGKIGKKQTLTLPIKHSVPAALADYLNGKYLIVVLDATNAVTQEASSAGLISAANTSGAVPPITLNGGTLTGLTGSLGLTSIGVNGTATLPPGTYTLSSGGILTLNAPVAVSGSGTMGTISAVGTILPTSGTVTTTATPVVSSTPKPGTTPVTTPPPKAVVPANEIIIGPIQLP